MSETPMRKEEMQRRPRREKYLMAGMYRSDPKSRIAPEMQSIGPQLSIVISCAKVSCQMMPERKARTCF